MADSDSDTASFHSLHSIDSIEHPTLTPAPAPTPTPTDPNPQPHRSDPNSQPITSPTKTTKKPPLVKIDRFPPEEEASLLSESNAQKTAANALFGKGNYSTAIQTYDIALSSCPNYLDYELAVLRSNIAACHIKLEEWKEAIASADKGVECLERLEPLPIPPRPRKEKNKKKNGDAAASPEEEDDDDEKLDDGIEEIDDDVADRIANLQASGRTLDQVRKLQIKLLLRRAKARTESGGWSSLQGADEDYRILLSPTMLPCLSPTDTRAATEAAQKLLPRLNAAKEAEMAEMMGKLKGLGNSILKPFGLSTENFQFVKDENSGGYSMNFEQNPAKK